MNLVQDFIPILERFFTRNPFPSRAVKAALARSSGMTVRQISVWVRTLNYSRPEVIQYCFSVSEPSIED